MWLCCCLIHLQNINQELKINNLCWSCSRIWPGSLWDDDNSYSYSYSQQPFPWLYFRKKDLQQCIGVGKRPQLTNPNTNTTIICTGSRQTYKSNSNPNPLFVNLQSKPKSISYVNRKQIQIKSRITKSFDIYCRVPPP